MTIKANGGHGYLWREAFLTEPVGRWVCAAGHSFGWSLRRSGEASLHRLQRRASPKVLDAYPADQESFDQETLCHLRGVVARLGGAAVLSQSLKSFALLGGVSVSHVLTQPVNQGESSQSFEAWRSSDFIQALVNGRKLVIGQGGQSSSFGGSL